MTHQYRPAYSAVAGFATVGLGCLVALGLQPGCLQSRVDARAPAGVPAPAVQSPKSQPATEAAPAVPATTRAVQPPPQVAAARPAVSSPEYKYHRA